MSTRRRKGNISPEFKLFSSVSCTSNISTTGRQPWGGGGGGGRGEGGGGRGEGGGGRGEGELMVRWPSH